MEQEIEYKAEYKTQIAVVGAGASGMAAAAAAAEKGASVIVLEANGAIGGNGLFPRGIFAVDSAVQRRKLIFADTDEIFKSCMEYSHWKLDARLVRVLIDKSGDTISWLIGKGVEFTDVVHHLPNQQPEVFHITGTGANIGTGLSTDFYADSGTGSSAGARLNADAVLSAGRAARTATGMNTGKAVITALKADCEKRDVEIFTGMRGKKLLTSEDGAVTGVVCEAKDGSLTKVEAEKVIICTGGFAGNPELVARFYPGFDQSGVTPGAGMRHKGDGLKMAVEVGAGIEGNFAMEIAAPKIKGHGPLNLLIGKPRNIWLNCFGERFADEGIVYDFTMAANACLRQPGEIVWLVFDEAAKKEALDDGRDMVELIHISPDAEEKLAETLIKAQQDGTLKVSESLADIAEFIGCSEKKLTTVVEEYNFSCFQNRDPIFAKQRRYLKPISTPPYYAIKAGADMLITHGGIRVNERFEALNDNFKVIKNLYIAGVDFGGADADVYNVVMSGHGFGFAVNSGRMAGEYAAQNI